MFCLETLPEALRGQPGAAWEPVLREAAEAERCRGHCRVREEFARPALTSLTLGMAAWLEDGRAEPKLVGDGRLERLITATTSPLLGRLARKVDKRGRQIERRSGKELHSLRKAMKKLRYAVEDLSGMYDAEAVTEYIAACKQLQKQLGRLNDAAVAAALAQSLAAGEHPGLAPGVAAVERWCERRRDKAVRHLGRAWSKFASTAAVWT